MPNLSDFALGSSSPAPKGGSGTPAPKNPSLADFAFGKASNESTAYKPGATVQKSVADTMATTSPEPEGYVSFEASKGIAGNFAALGQNEGAFLSHLPTYSKAASGAIDTAVDTVGGWLADSSFVKNFAKAADRGAPALTGGKAAPLDALAAEFDKTLNVLATLGLSSIKGYTGGILAPTAKTDDIADGSVEKYVRDAVGIVGQGLGMMGSIATIGRATGGLTTPASFISMMNTYPRLAKYAIPLIQNASAFSLYGQLNPELAGNMGQRASTFLTDLATAPLYTAMGMIKSAKYSLPASFGLGFGMAKLSGADNATAVSSGLAFSLLDGVGRANAPKFVNGRQVDDALKAEAYLTLSKYSGMKVTGRTSPEDLQLAWRRAAKATHPDLGGKDADFTQARLAYEFLTGESKAFNPKGPEAQDTGETAGEKTMKTLKAEAVDALTRNHPPDVVAEEMASQVNIPIGKAHEIVQEAAREENLSVPGIIDTGTDELLQGVKQAQDKAEGKGTGESSPQVGKAPEDAMDAEIEAAAAEAMSEPPREVEEVLGELSDSPEMKSDWAENHADSFQELSDKASELEKRIKETKDRTDKEKMMKEYDETTSEMARMENGFIEKWSGEAEKIANQSSIKEKVGNAIARTETPDDKRAERKASLEKPEDVEAAKKKGVKGILRGHVEGREDRMKKILAMKDAKARLAAFHDELGSGGGATITTGKGFSWDYSPSRGFRVLHSEQDEPLATMSDAQLLKAAQEEYGIVSANEGDTDIGGDVRSGEDSERGPDDAGGQAERGSSDTEPRGEVPQRKRRGNRASARERFGPPVEPTNEERAAEVEKEAEGRRKEKDITNETIKDFVSDKTKVSDTGEVEITGDISDEEREMLTLFTGAGGMEKNGAEGRGLLDEYYTPPDIVSMVSAVLDRIGAFTPKMTVLEPAAGIGAFLGDLPDGAIVGANEINDTAARILKLLHPEATVHASPFEDTFMSERGQKRQGAMLNDLVIGNPPYGEHRGRYKGMGEEPNISKYEEYFIKRGLDVTREGGHVAMVVPSSFLRGGWTKSKEAISRLGRVVAAYRLPNGAFPTTDIGTDIVVFKREDGNFDGTRLFQDQYFKEHPENVLGEPTEKKGRYGMEPWVEGSLDSAAGDFFASLDEETASELITPEDTTPAEYDEALTGTQDEIADSYKTDHYTEVRKEPKVKAAAKASKEAQAKADKKNAKVQIVSPKKKGKLLDLATLSKADAKDAALWKYVQPTGELAGDFPKEDAFYYRGQYFNGFNYLQGDIYEKLSALEEDKKAISAEQYDKQKAALEAVKPAAQPLDRITVTPNSRFAQELNVTENGEEKPITEHFLDWVSELPFTALGDSSSYAIRGYVRNQAVRGGDKVSNENERRTRRIEGDRLFKLYLSDELSQKNQSAFLEAYNRSFNSYVRPDYLKVPLTTKLHAEFDGRPLTIRDVQLQGIGFLLNRGVGLLAHDVGVGKTIQGIIANAEILARGWAKKPLIVVPNISIYNQWVREMQDIVPDIKINLLANLGGDFKGDLKTLVVPEGSISMITEEGFKRLGFKDETYEKLTRDFQDVIENPNEKKTKRRLAKETAQAEEHMGKGVAGTTEDRFFEDLGFDYITMDEVHNANHIIPRAKMSEGQVSEFRAFQVQPSIFGIKTWLAAQYIQDIQKGRGFIGLSAGPFTNNPLEYYSILSLMARERMRRMGILNVNDFMTMFMNISTELEFKANGEYLEKSEVRSFKNYQQFQKLLTEFIDFKDGADAGVVRPDRQSREYRVAQTDDGFKYSQQAQALFLDVKNAGALKAINELRAIAFTPYLSKYYDGKAPSVKDLVENSPKLRAMVTVIKQSLKDKPEAGHLIYSTIGVEYFPLLKQYFIDEKIVKPDQIDIISGATPKPKRSGIQERFNAGAVKIVIGSDAIMEGVNLQKNTTDLHILSLPWNFTSLRQVIGRGWRQGNRWPRIRVNNYFTENSVDTFLSQKLQNKEKRYEESLKFKGDTLDVGDIDFDELKFDLITDPVARTELEYKFKQQELELEIKQKLAEQGYKQRKVAQLVDAQTKYRKAEQLAAQHDWAKANAAAVKATLEETKRHLRDRGIDVEAIEKELEDTDKDVEKLRKRIESLTEEKAKAIIEAAKGQKVLYEAPDTDFEKFARDRADDNATFYKGGPLFERINTRLFERVLSTSIVQELAGRVSVSRQFVEDLAKRQEVKKPEREAITESLAEMPDAGTLNVEQFAEKVVGKLLPLDTNILVPREEFKGEGFFREGVAQYENVHLQDSGNYDTYREVIYQSPVENRAGQVHFGVKSAPRYFAHVRTDNVEGEDMDETIRRVLEIQSDLFQRGRFENQKPSLTFSMTPPVEQAMAFLTKEERDRFEETRHEELTKATLQEHDALWDKAVAAWQADKKEAYDARVAELDKLAPYRNTWWERIVREEVKRAATDGVSALRFPTGATAMRIEGLSDSPVYWVDKETQGQLTASMLKPGMEIMQDSSDMGISFGMEDEDRYFVVVSVAGDGTGAFTAVPADRSIEIDNGEGGSFESTWRDATPEERKQIETYSAEAFTVDSTVDTNNPIYEFYEKDVQRYLRKIRPDLNLVEDEQGVEWFETKIDALDHERPVLAFQRTPFDAYKYQATTFAEGKAALEEYKKRLNLDFDVDFAQAIFTGEYEGAGFEKHDAMARAVTYNNKITLTENLTRTTADHELVHLVSGNLENIPAFADINRGDLLKAVNGGRDYSPREVEMLEEKLAQGFEEYVAGKGGKQANIILRFFAALKKLLTDLLNALRGDTDVVADFYKRLRTAEGKEPVVFESSRQLDADVRMTATGDSILDFGPTRAAELRAEQGRFFERMKGMEIPEDEGSVDLVRKDINDLEGVLAQARDIYLKDPNEFKAAKEYETIGDNRRMKKTALDKRFSKMLNPYFKGLDKAGREKVNKVLMQGDLAGKEYTAEQLRSLNLTAEQAAAYNAVRLAFNTAQEVLIAEMVKNGVSPEEVAEYDAERVGYMPHKWKYRFVVKTQELTGKGSWRTVSMDNYKSKRLADAAWEKMKAENESTNKRFILDTLDNLAVDFFTEQRLSFGAMKTAMEQAKTGDDIKKAMIDALRNMAKEKGFGRHYIRRTGVLGYEEKDVPKLIADYFAGLNGYITKMEAGKLYYDALSTIDARRQSKFYAWMRDAIAYDMGNSNENVLGINVKQLAFSYYLANDISFLLTNATQNFTVGMGELSKYMEGNEKILGPETRLIGAMKDWAIGNVTPDERAAVESLVALGRLGGEQTSEMMGFKNNPLYNEISSFFSKALYHSTAWTESNVNRIPAFLAARRLFIDKGMSVKEANEKGLSVAEDIHFRYGKQHRASFERGKKGIFFVFYHYMRSLLFQLYRDLSQKEYAAFARKMLYTAVLGGTMSLPFGQTLVTIYRAIFGAGCTAGKDGDCQMSQEMPSWLLALERGIPALAGVDMSGRVGVDIFSISSIINDPLNVLSYIGGVGNLVFDRIPKGVQLLFEDRLTDAMGKLLPDLAANFVKAYAGYEWGVRSFAGTPLLDGNGDPLKYTAWEAFVRATGFTPTRENLAWDATSKSFIASDDKSAAQLNIRHTVEAQVQRGEYAKAAQTQSEAIAAGTIAPGTNYIKEFGKTTFIKDALADWNDGPKTSVELRTLENKIISDIYPSGATPTQELDVRKEFAVYRAFGMDNKLANDLLGAKSTADAAAYLYEAQKTMKPEEFSAFLAAAQKTVNTAKGNPSAILVTGPILTQYQKDLKSFSGTEDKPGSLASGTYDKQSFMTHLVNAAQALGTDPVTFFNREFSGEKIVRVQNGTIYVERIPVGESEAIKREGGGANPSMKLDHTVPLELGGSNAKENLRLVTTAEWASYTPVENLLGDALSSGTITKSEAQNLITRFKNKELTMEQVEAAIKKP